jgi:hypothetical protein
MIAFRALQRICVAKDDWPYKWLRTGGDATNADDPSVRAHLIAGVSMGGHVAGAAVERETLADAHHKVRYAGALPMCGAMGDTELQSYFAAYHLAAMQVAGMAAPAFPISDWHDVQAAAQAALAVSSTWRQIFGLTPRNAMRNR